MGLSAPVVLAHGRALLAGDTTVIVDGDLRDAGQILRHPDVRRAIDFARPVAVLLLAILHFVTDEEDPAGMMAHLRDSVVPGSYLVLSHATADFNSDAATKAARAYDRASVPLVLRGRAEIERLFQGFELVEPGLVQLAAWRPDESPTQGQEKVWACVCGGCPQAPVGVGVTGQRDDRDAEGASICMMAGVFRGRGSLSV